jgi:hypothetical protein
MKKIISVFYCIGLRECGGRHVNLLKYYLYQRCPCHQNQWFHPQLRCFSAAAGGRNDIETRQKPDRYAPRIRNFRWLVNNAGVIIE